MYLPRLNDLERRAYRTLVDDGLLDLAFGLFFLSFFLSDHLPFDGFPGIAFVICAYGWTRARQILVEPRVGTVELSAERRARIRRAKLWIIGVMTVPIVLIFLWAVVFTDMDKPLGGYGSLVIGLIFGSALIGGAWMLDLRRFWIYAGALLAASLWKTFVFEPFDGFQFAVSGTLAALVGTTVLLRFLSRNPPLDPGENWRQSTHG